MKRFVLIILFFASIIVKAQDLIVLRNGDTVSCKITKIDSSYLYFDLKRGNRIITSFVDKNEIRSYRLNNQTDSIIKRDDSIKPAYSNEVIIDSSEYIKPSRKWINLITYSQKYGIHATGWSIQYYGYVLQNDSKWIIPCSIGLESFNINSEYFSQCGYQSAKMSYCIAGISPFKRFNDHLFLNLGLQFLWGTEQLTDFIGFQRVNSVFGIAPSQGLFYIPQSDFGLTIGLSTYEKLLTSEVYKNDLGIKLEIGIKF